MTQRGLHRSGLWSGGKDRVERNGSERTQVASVAARKSSPPRGIRRNRETEPVAALVTQKIPEAIIVKEAVGLLVFDLDGTLIDSKVDLANSVNHALGEFGLPALPHPLIYSYVGDGATVLIRKSLGDEGNGILHAVLDAFLAHYRQHLLDTTVPYPGVPENLGKWEKSYRMAVLTNKPLDMTLAILSGLALDRHFIEVVGGDGVHGKKPLPDGLLRIMRSYGASPEETLMVGDSRNDVLAGKRAGARTCGVTYGLGTDGFAEYPPDFTIGRFSELFDRIRPTT